MRKQPIYIFFISFFILNMQLIYAQGNYTDYDPNYRKWNENYIIDKISYKKNGTIFYFRFVTEASETNSAIFYNKNGEAPWFLKSKTDNQEFELIAIKNIRKNGRLLTRKLNNKKQEYNANGPYKMTVFTCEVHFPSLPKSVTQVDLIEGRGKEDYPNHFHCFAVSIKNKNDNNLGSKKDSKNRIKKFDKVHGVVSNKPSPTIPKNISKKDPPKKDPPKNPIITENKINRPVTVKEKPKAIVLIEKPDVFNHRQKMIPCDKKLLLHKIYYRDMGVIHEHTEDANNILHVIKQYLLDNEKAKMSIFGHTDVFGDPDIMLKLSQQRVKWLKSWFVLNGVPKEKIHIEGLGASQPIYKKDDSRHIGNRRVEFKITCK